jgi:hypothetical protein
MIRKLVTHGRDEEVTRLEGFSDAVFGFAMTLLVVSLEAPASFEELLADMRGFVAFGICFGLLVLIWYRHYIFFRRYGLRTTPVLVVLNAALLFVVLLYVYPLKFLFTYLVGEFTGFDNDIRLPDGTVRPLIAPGQTSLLVIIYGIGFVAVFLAFALLYCYAYSKRGELALNTLETFDTKVSVQAYLIEVGVGFVSIAIAAFGGEPAAATAGWAYLYLLTPLRAIHGIVMGRRRSQIGRDNALHPVETS